MQKILFAILLLVGWTKSQGLEGPYVRQNLTLRIVVRYPESKLTTHSPPLSSDLFIVGNGLGLSWNTPIRLSRGAAQDTWSIDLKFYGGIDGYRCSGCSQNQILAVNTRLEYRILTSDFGDMVGPNFGVPIHTVAKMEPDFPAREHVSYPFFFTRQGTVQLARVTSSDPVLENRNWNYYLPASFAENIYKTYPVAVILDTSAITMERLRSHYEEAYYGSAIAEEVVLIGSDDYRIQGNSDGRGTLLTPVTSINWQCRTGNFLNRCNGCLPENTTNREYVEYMRDGCGNPVTTGGYGEQYLTHIVDEVLPVVKSLTSNRLRTDRDNLAVSGCSLGGLFACHAAWTRPEAIGKAACQSSSFWWPGQVDGENGFHFLNQTVKLTHLGPRAPQKVYIDVTDLEDDEYYAQVGAALDVVNTMVKNSPQFRLDETLFFTLVNGQEHSNENCFSRTWLYLASLFPPSGGARNPNLLFGKMHLKREHNRINSWFGIRKAAIE